MEAHTATGSSAPGGDQFQSSTPSRGPTEAELTLPNLIIIGAQKCGTSGLHYYLSLHPEISMSNPKELNFFIAERNWPRGLEWYSRHFDPRATVRGDASPNYTSFPNHTGVPERMAEVVPEAKLIYIVRDPIERIGAHWVHNYAKRREKGTMSETLLHPNTSYVSRSKYYMQLRRFLDHFPQEQILVLENSELRDDRAATLRAIFEFLEVDSSFEHPKFEAVRHSTSRKKRATKLGMRIQRMSKSKAGRRIPRRAWLALDVALPLSKPIGRPSTEQVREALGPEVIEVLHEDADRLRKQTGKDLAHWSV